MMDDNKTMVEIRATDKQDIERARLFLERLRSFPLLEDLDAIISENGSRGDYTIYRQYPGGHKVTQVDTMIKGSIGYIRAFRIKEGLRGEGHGRELYGCVELFLRDQGVTTISLSPAEDGIEFWPKMGFSKKSSIELQKLL